MKITRGLIFTLLFRSFSICSSFKKFHLEIEKLKSIFKNNSYPVNFIDICIKSFLDKLYVPKRVLHTVPKKELLIILPYLGKHSINIKSRLYSCISKALPYCQLKINFQSRVRLGNLFAFKDIIHIELRSNLVYKFSCSNCNFTYYGKTERHLKVRVSEH